MFVDTGNGTVHVKQYMRCFISWVGGSRIQKFYITPRGGRDFILGRDFFKRADVWPDCRRKGWTSNAKPHEVNAYDTPDSLTCNMAEAKDFVSFACSGIPHDDTCPRKDRKAVEKVVADYHDPGCFDSKPGLVETVECEVDTGSNTPYRAAPRPMNKPKREILDNILDKLLKDDIVAPCSGPDFLSCPVLVKKKVAPGKAPNWRLCVDYRILNSKTKSRPHVMPRIDYVLSQLGLAMIFSTIDLSQGYHQIMMARRDRDKTAFVTPHRGAIRYKRMPIGLKNAWFTFQNVMDRVLDGALYKHCMAFLDDVVIYSNSWEEHAVHLADVFERLEKAGFTVNPNKVHIGCRRMWKCSPSLPHHYLTC